MGMTNPPPERFPGMFFPPFHKPTVQFIGQALYGIQASGEVKLASWVKMPREGISAKKVEDRLSRNLSLEGKRRPHARQRLHGLQGDCAPERKQTHHPPSFQPLVDDRPGLPQRERRGHTHHRPDPKRSRAKRHLRLRPGRGQLAKHGLDFIMRLKRRNLASWKRTGDSESLASQVAMSHRASVRFDSHGGESRAI